MSYQLAIDFGGTRLRAGLFDEHHRLVDRTETLTGVPEGQQAVLDRIVQTAKSICPPSVNLRAIGVAAPGPLDADKGLILEAKTLPRWYNVPIGKIISEAFDNIPTFVQNDGNLGAIAEYYRGSGQGANPMIYLTISTGIGGGIIIDGKLFTGARSLAAEPGHMRLTLPDGSHHRLEELASGTALGLWARDRLKTSDVKSSLRDVEIVDGKAVGKAAMAGDKCALEIVNQAGHWLGLGFANLVHLFNPEAIVIGGSVTKLGDLIVGPARKTLMDSVLIDNFISEDLIRYAKIYEDMCLVGASIYCLRNSKLNS